MSFRERWADAVALGERLTVKLLLAVLSSVLLFIFAFNFHYSSGVPYWDDWQYFFGPVQGLHAPLTLESLLAKEADYVAPLLRAVGHGLWLVAGANFLFLRLVAWALFAVMLALYARLLLRVVPGQRPLVIAIGGVLLSIAVSDYFYYQHMALSQPLFFSLFFIYLYAAAAGSGLLAAVALALCASYSIFGAAYAAGAVGYAILLAVAAWPQRRFAGFADPRVWAGAPICAAAVAGVAYFTFTGSYVNHTGQGLVLPWSPDFWAFTFSAFAAALGFTPDMGPWGFLALGGGGFLLFTVPLWRMLRRGVFDPAGRDPQMRAEFVLGAVLCGGVLTILMTATGRVYLCGTDLPAIMSCGASNRYVYPLVLSLPAMAAAVALSLPPRRLLRPAAVLGIIGVLAAGYLLDHDGRVSVARWRFAPLNQMMVERDAGAQACLRDYLAQALPAAGGDPDWSRPLVCPGMWAAKNLTPYLKTAYETGARFLAPILAGLDAARREPTAESLLADGALTLSLDGATGRVDQFYRLKDGVPAVSGWAVDMADRTPVVRVLVLDGNRVVAAGHTGFDRPDVAAALGTAAARRSGFVVPLPESAADGRGLRVIAVTADRRQVELPGPVPAAGSRIVPAADVTGYMDGRPANFYRLDAQDAGVALRHGDGPGHADLFGARDVWVFRHGDTVYMHYDAAGPTGWLAALAVSRDGARFEKKGPILALGQPGEDDSASASYGVTHYDGEKWRMFYLGTPNVTPPPDRIPAFPYLTMAAEAASPAGPWVKRPDLTPFRPRPGTYYNSTASPGQIIRHNGEYLQFFSAAMPRTLGLARADSLDGPWRVDPAPILPPEEQIENAALYFQESTGTWFLFTNHVGLRDGVEYTDAIWVYWTQDPLRWRAGDKAVVLDERNALWSKNIIGLPSVLPIGGRLALYYDGLRASAAHGEPFGHMRRDIGLAWLNLPIALPERRAGEVAATPRLRDAFEPLVAPPVPPAAGASPLDGSVVRPVDGQCHLDQLNGAPPSDQPAPLNGFLKVGGWSVISAQNGTAVDETLLTLTPADGATGGETLYARTRRTPRPDVKAHFARPDMGDPGFAALLDLRGRRGTYRLGLAQVSPAAVQPCDLGQTVVLE